MSWNDHVIDSVIIDKNLWTHKENNTNYKQKNYKFVVGDLVEHTYFGPGKVVEVVGNNVDIKFDNEDEIITINANHKTLNKLNGDGKK